LFRDFVGAAVARRDGAMQSEEQERVALDEPDQAEVGAGPAAGTLPLSGHSA
jgi:hypothetical protein